MFTDGGSARTTRRQIGDWFDAVYVAGVVLISLLPLYIKSATGVLFIALPALFAYFRYQRLGPVFSRSSLLMAIGGWAVLSAFWSPYPGTTVYFGLQFALTILAACFIGAGTRPEQTVYGLFAGMFVHGIAVLVYGLLGGNYYPFQNDVDPFVGLAGSKNTTADMASLGVMTALAMLAHGIRMVRPVTVLLALILIAVDVATVSAAQSAGANAALALASAFFLGWWITSTWPIAGRTAIMAVAVITGAVASATRSVWYPLLFERYLEFAGKDDDLTGRIYIWSRADVAIDNAPWFGRGYASFWVEGDLEPTAIWDAMFVANHIGFNFHNSVYEVLVYFGYVGLVAVSAIFIGYSLLLARRMVIDPHPVTILFAALIAYDGLRFSFESLPLGIFAHSTVFLYGALSHGVGIRFSQRRTASAPGLARPGTHVRSRGLIRTGI